MPYRCGSYHVIEKTAISAGVYSYAILCPEVAVDARPGQFVHIKVEGFTLRRPVSICDIDHKNGSIRIVFEIRGHGTAKLADANVGDNIDMIAPLGNGFTLPDGIAPDRRVITVGGGIGVAPLLGAAKAFRENATAILGFRSYDKIILANDFKQSDVHVITCTDDGSVGLKGTVTTPLEAELAKNDTDMVYACGPQPMLAAIVRICEKAGVKCEVSLEQRMGCGVGACAVCACGITRQDKEYMLMVCKDGPVFKGEEVLL
ncbi:MAG: dihydroorotate dehydrogenase electron transfer subunit [Oscillospiraceae bacterium]|jgi:dihydroorotate dehydrogenase electron transfer subunit|nr:dihydroorotate dehydrogenase electron transfer subunit [Oscillospiraceae bacterium]